MSEDADCAERDQQGPPFWVGLGLGWTLLVGGPGLAVAFWYRDWSYLTDTVPLIIAGWVMYGLASLLAVAASYVMRRVRDAV